MSGGYRQYHEWANDQLLNLLPMVIYRGKEDQTKPIPYGIVTHQSEVKEALLLRYVTEVQNQSFCIFFV